MADTLYSVIVPTYNEAENLPTLIYLLKKVKDVHSVNLEIIIVEDASPDGTGQVAQALAAKLPELRIKILHRAGKLGLGTAYTEGLKLCSGSFVIIMDADLSHLPEYIPGMIALQNQTNADIVFGTRYAKGGSVEGWPFQRKFVSRCANLLARLSLGMHYSDMTGSFRLYKRTVIESLMPAITCRGYAFQMQILVRAAHAGYKIQQVPIVFVDRIFGKSKLGTGEIVQYLKGLATLFFTF